MQAEKLTAIVDIGGSKAACLIARQGPGPDGAPAFEVVGAGQQGVPRRDLRADLADAAEKAVRGAVEAAERMAGARISSVSVALNGRHLTSRHVGVDLDLAGAPVSREDMLDCLEEGALAAAGEGTRALHALPIGFSVDGEDVGANPCGAIGRLLRAELLGVAVHEEREADIRALMERCDLSVRRVFAAPRAAGEAVLVEDEKDLGVLLLDLGARSTEFALYEEGALIACGGVSLGGENVTRDVAQLFNCPLADAERLKTLHGSAIAGLEDEHRLLDVAPLASAEEVSQVARAEVCAVIAPRVEEIFTLVAREIDAASTRRSRSGQGLRRVVLTGGGSLLAGVREAAERVLRVRARCARPLALPGAPEAATAPQFAVCVGGLLLERAAREERVRANRHLPLYREDFAGERTIGLVRRTAHWLRANF